MPIRCAHCGGAGSYSDQDGVLRCLLCGRVVVGDSGNGDKHLDPAKVNALMQTPPPGGYRSLRAAVPVSLDFDGE